jgi:hypothetical protein
MTDDDTTTDVHVQGPAIVEVDAEQMAQIIFDTCHTTEGRATTAANLIVDYLIKVYSNPSKPQQ